MKSEMQGDCFLPVYTYKYTITYSLISPSYFVQNRCKSKLFAINYETQTFPLRTAKLVWVYLQWIKK